MVIWLTPSPLNCPRGYDPIKNQGWLNIWKLGAYIISEIKQLKLILENENVLKFRIGFFLLKSGKLQKSLKNCLSFVST